MSPLASPRTTSSAASSPTARSSGSASPRRRPFQAVLFDLDHTLFDSDRAERVALATVLRARGLPFNAVTLETYRRINVGLWADYRRGTMNQARIPTERARRLLQALGASTRGAAALGRDYLAAFARRGDLLPGSRGALRRLARRYRLGVVTNGIDHVQRSRLRASGLAERFEVVVTSEGAGCAKPDPRIMQQALAALRLPPEQALYVGDNPEADGLAARRARVPFCWIDRGTPFPRRCGRPRLRVRHVPELADRLLGPASH